MKLSSWIKALTMGGALTCAGISTQAHAATILGFQIGGGTWNAEPSGDFGADGQAASAEELGLEDNNNTFFYAALEHPIPVLPNVKLVSQELKTSGQADITRTFTFGNQQIDLTGDSQSEFDLSHIDGVLYYEILDNWVTLDLGVTLRVFDATADVSSDDVQGEKIDEEFTGVVPLAYASARFDLPFTGWHVASTGQFLSFDDNSITDLSAGIGYMSDGLVMDIGFELGYRTMDLKIDDEDFNADIKIDGMYGSLNVHF